jgi:hypothetical protein
VKITFIKYVCENKRVHTYSGLFYCDFINYCFEIDTLLHEIWFWAYKEENIKIGFIWKITEKNYKNIPTGHYIN